MNALANELSRLSARESLLKEGLKARNAQRKLATSQQYVSDSIAANPAWTPSANEDELSIARSKKESAAQEKYLSAQRKISDRYSKLKAAARAAFAA